MTWLIIILIAGIAMGIATQLFGREKMMDTFFGSPDLGRTVFSQLKRPRRRNHCLACPRDFSKDNTADITTDTYPVSAEKLRDNFREAMKKERRLERVHTNDPAMRERYVQRSELFRFPDTIQIEYIAIGTSQSSIALYSRSKIGFGDGGVNKARIKRWLKRLDKKPAK